MWKGVGKSRGEGRSGTYVCELVDGHRLDSHVLLAQLILNLIETLGHILRLKHSTPNTLATPTTTQPVTVNYAVAITSYRIVTINIYMYIYNKG